MIIYIDTFQKILEQKTQVTFSILPSQRFPNYLRIVRKDKKSIPFKALCVIKRIATPGTICSRDCVHFFVDGEILEKGCIKVIGVI